MGIILNSLQFAFLLMILMLQTLAKESPELFELAQDFHDFVSLYSL
jgi:hypothetical protein